MVSDIELKIWADSYVLGLIREVTWKFNKGMHHLIGDALCFCFVG